MTANRLSPGQDRARLGAPAKGAENPCQQAIFITSDHWRQLYPWAACGQYVDTPASDPGKDVCAGFYGPSRKAGEYAEHVSPERVPSTMIYRAITPIGPLRPVATGGRRFCER
jgi:hypothetical protein